MSPSAMHTTSFQPAIAVVSGLEPANEILPAGLIAFENRSSA
jgi:hypothetical protein